jgi:hypothetical protein
MSLPTKFINYSLTLPSPKGTGILEESTNGLSMVLAKTPYTLKTTTSTKGIAIALTFIFLLSESIAMPVRYAQHPAIICPLTIPNQVGYVRCRDFSVLG